jgi:hypothetical protein
MRKILIIPALVALYAAPSASAAVTYKLDAINLNSMTVSFEDYELLKNFSISITVPDYIRETGLNPLSGPLETSLGYEVYNFGASSIGILGFSRDGGLLEDYVMAYSNASFGFFPQFLQENYYSAPGVYSGSIFGTVPVAGRIEGMRLLQGSATLTITETLTSGVPEPSAWGLMILGFGAVGAILRRRNYTAKIRFG